MNKNVDEIIKDIIQNISFEQSIDILGKKVQVDEKTIVIPLLKTSIIFGEVKSHLPFERKGIKKNELLFESSEELYPYGGGNAGNIKTEPCALLVINNGKVKFIRMEEANPFLKILEMSKDIFLAKKNK